MIRNVLVINGKISFLTIKISKKNIAENKDKTLLLQKMLHGLEYKDGGTHFFMITGTFIRERNYVWIDCRVRDHTHAHKFYLLVCF